ncbi:MAG: DUF3192 domain-containing protein [Gammaproteobacteria bacterium]|nr:DUF3192 domain-containing protein [Gammaproteobacteria bacterium]
MNRNLKAALFAIPLTFSLTGCVIVANDDDTRADWIGSSSSDWKQEQKENKRKIAELEVGQSFSSVRSEMGTPEFNEAFTQNGKKYQVLFYRTRHKHSDGQTTKSECTPLIFVDGVLNSWGDKAYNKL